MRLEPARYRSAAGCSTPQKKCARSGPLAWSLVSAVAQLSEQDEAFSRPHGAGIKLLGFKDRAELAFEDNTKHSFFVYPDEMVRFSLSSVPEPPGDL